MRTKTLLMTAAVMAAGLGASVAQTVYSVNSVGYVNKTLHIGYSLIANPLKGTNNNINTILPVVADGTYVIKWNAATQTFVDPEQYYEGLGWLPGTADLAPGEGAFIHSDASQPVTFVGEVSQGTSISNSIHGVYSLISHIVPQSISLGDPTVTFPAQDGDYVIFWNEVSQTYTDPTQFYDGIGWLPTEPTPAVGEAFFYNTGAGAGRGWIRSFSVN